MHVQNPLEILNYFCHVHIIISKRETIASDKLHKTVRHANKILKEYDKYMYLQKYQNIQKSSCTEKDALLHTVLVQIFFFVEMFLHYIPLI